MNWQKCKEPKDAGQWITPPNREEPIVHVSYTSGDNDVIYRRTWDRNDGTRSYERRFLAEGELFEPWQQEPA